MLLTARIEKTNKIDSSIFLRRAGEGRGKELPATNEVEMKFSEVPFRMKGNTTQHCRFMPR